MGIKLKDVKSGEFVRRKPDAKTTFTKGHYDRSSKKYSLSDTEDFCREIFLSGNTVVYTEFTY